HVKTRALLDHCQADASGADDGDGLARDLVAKERQEWVPRRPLLLSHQPFTLPHLAREHSHHKKSEFGGRFSEDVGGVRERDLVLVGIGPVDVIEAHGDLRHDLERTPSGFEDLGVDGIAERGDQCVDAALHFLDDQLFRRRLGTLENFELVAALAKTILGWIADARCGKDAKMLTSDHTENFSGKQELRKKLDRIRESTGFPRQFLLCCVPQRFRFAQLPTRSSAFSMFSMELATLKRK